MHRGGGGGANKGPKPDKRLGKENTPGDEGGDFKRIYRQNVVEILEQRVVQFCYGMLLSKVRRVEAQHRRPAG